MLHQTGCLIFAAFFAAALNATRAEYLFRKKRIDKKIRDKRQLLWGLGIIFTFGLLDKLLGLY